MVPYGTVPITIDKFHCTVAVLTTDSLPLPCNILKYVALRPYNSYELSKPEFNFPDAQLSFR